MLDHLVPVLLDHEVKEGRRRRLIIGGQPMKFPQAT